MLTPQEFVWLYPDLAETITQMVDLEYIYADEIASLAMKFEAFAKFAEFVVQRHEYSTAICILHQYAQWLLDAMNLNIRH